VVGHLATARKLTAKSVAERILKIDQHLAKLDAKI